MTLRTKIEEAITKQDIIIPLGTRFTKAPNERGGKYAIEAVIPLGKDSCGYFNIPISALEDCSDSLINSLEEGK